MTKNFNKCTVSEDIVHEQYQVKEKKLKSVFYPNTIVQHRN